MTAAIPCVARRDVLLRSFPTILGSVPTAMEVKRVSWRESSEFRILRNLVEGVLHAREKAWGLDFRGYAGLFHRSENV
jgi:hypothetical protein